MLRVILLWWLCLLGAAVRGQDETEVPDIFFDFGTDAGDDVLPPNDDGYSNPITISDEFTFFASRYSTLFVSKPSPDTVGGIKEFLKRHGLICILLYDAWLVLSSRMIDRRCSKFSTQETSAHSLHYVVTCRQM